MGHHRQYNIKTSYNILSFHLLILMAIKIICIKCSNSYVPVYTRTDMTEYSYCIAIYIIVVLTVYSCKITCNLKNKLSIGP